MNEWMSISTISWREEKKKIESKYTNRAVFLAYVIVFDEAYEWCTVWMYLIIINNYVN